MHGGLTWSRIARNALARNDRLGWGVVLIAPRTGSENGQTGLAESGMVAYMSRR